jgi:hypothetical protein
MKYDPDHPVFSPPTDINVKIWRYMDLSKYLSLLDSSALFFSRADLLGDPYEGATSHANRILRPSVYGAGVDPSMFEGMSSFQQWIRQWTFINCWHMNENESDAMWRIYARTSDAVAIQSTFARLQRVLSDRAFIGVVKYVDYDTEWMPEGNTFYPFVHKRKSFEHERELRAVMQELPSKADPDGKTDSVIDRIPNGEEGRGVSVQLPDIIERVYIAPTSPAWFQEIVRSVTAKYKLDAPVEQSALDRLPEF